MKKFKGAGIPRWQSSVRWIQIALRTVIGSFFCYSGVSKLVWPPSSETLYQKVVAGAHLPWWMIALAEVGFGLWMVMGIRPRLAAIISVIVLSSFSGLLASEFTKEEPKPCGCLGVVALTMDVGQVRKELWYGLARNLAMLLGAAWLACDSSVDEPMLAIEAGPTRTLIQSEKEES